MNVFVMSLEKGKQYVTQRVIQSSPGFVNIVKCVLHKLEEKMGIM